MRPRRRAAPWSRNSSAVRPRSSGRGAVVLNRARVAPVAASAHTTPIAATRNGAAASIGCHRAPSAVKPASASTMRYHSGISGMAASRGAGSSWRLWNAPVPQVP